MKRNVLIAAIAATLFSAAAWSQWGPGAGGGPGGGFGFGMGPGMMQRGAGGFGPGGGFGAGACGMDPAAMTALGLTAEQRAQIAAIQDEVSDQRLALMESMHQLRSQALRSGEPRTGANYEAMAQLREQMFELSRATRERIDAVLTPEQREQLRGGWRGFAYRR